MTHSRSISLALLLMAGLGGCGDSGSQTNGDNGSGPPYSGSNGSGNGMGNDDGNGDTDPSANVDPTYPTQHPRIYIAANKQRLQASLSANTPAAKTFKSSWARHRLIRPPHPRTRSRLIWRNIKPTLRP